MYTSLRHSSTPSIEGEGGLCVRRVVFVEWGGGVAIMMSSGMLWSVCVDLTGCPLIHGAAKLMCTCACTHLMLEWRIRLVIIDGMTLPEEGSTCPLLPHNSRRRKRPGYKFGSSVFSGMHSTVLDRM